jgi:LacI family transcriptional regulator
VKPHPHHEIEINKPVSLRDLARLAKVDMSTVSRSLNNDPRITVERAIKIRELARSLGYRPRPLRSKNTRTIGLFLNSNSEGPASQFIGRIFWLIEHLLSDRGFHVNLTFFSSEDKKISIPKIVQENRVDGLILAGQPPVALIRALKRFGIPMVAINDSVDRIHISCVRSNPMEAIREIVLRLAAWGHREISLSLQNLEIPMNQARKQAFLDALNFVGIKPRKSSVLICNKDEVAGGREAVRQLLKLPNKTTALLCENDWMAIGALHELGKHKIMSPRNISVSGHDDVPICRDFSPALTTIHRSEQTLVTEAIELLLKQIQDHSDTPQEKLIAGKVIWRESTGPVQ